jgi:uncharacterized protein YcaQ
MPLLRGDRLVGRVDPYFERKTRTLQVRSIHLEAGAALGDDGERAIADLAAFAGATAVRRATRARSSGAR